MSHSRNTWLINQFRKNKTYFSSVSRVCLSVVSYYIIVLVFQAFCFWTLPIHGKADRKGHKFVLLLSLNHSCSSHPVGQWECPHFVGLNLSAFLITFPWLYLPPWELINMSKFEKWFFSGQSKTKFSFEYEKHQIRQ